MIRIISMQKSIILNGQPVDYIIRASKVARRLRLTINRDGQLVATLPRRASLKMLEKFILEKSAWIIQQIERVKKLPPHINSRQDYLANKAAALVLVQDRINHFNQHYNFQIGKITVRNQSSRWGSCSIRGNLNFNYRIAFLAPRLADYIVVHELCHLRQFNHSAKFWALVAETMPDHLVIRQEIRRAGLRLM